MNETVSTTAPVVETPASLPVAVAHLWQRAADARRHLYLAVKEVVHNAVKHASAVLT